MEIKRIEQVKTDLQNSILVSRKTVVDLADHALQLEAKARLMAQLIDDQLFPRFVRAEVGPDFVECPACGASVAGTNARISEIHHEDDCLYVLSRNIMGDADGQPK